MRIQRRRAWDTLPAEATPEQIQKFEQEGVGGRQPAKANSVGEADFE